MIPLFKSSFDASEQEAVRAVIDSGWLSQGEQVAALEQGFAELLGGNIACFATSNCTLALYLAMRALDIGPGDEVVVPAQTFVADANVVRLCGATPVFADITAADDFNVSVETVERCLTERTRAVMVVHFAGYACDMSGLSALCKSRDIAMVEDCAHAPGATHQGQALGTLGDISCFSFYANKNLSTGEGGMVCSTQPELAERLSHLRSHGMTRATLDKTHGRVSQYDVIEPSINARMDEMRAAIGLVQLRKLEPGNVERRVMVKHYRQLLAPVMAEFAGSTTTAGQAGNGLLLPFAEYPLEYSACHILPVVLPAAVDRTTVMSKLRDSGIQSSIHYAPFWEFEAYRHVRAEDTPVFASIAQRMLTLPLSPGFERSETRSIVDSLMAACRCEAVA